MAKTLQWLLKIQDGFSAPIKGMVSEVKKLQVAVGKNADVVGQVDQSVVGLTSQMGRLRNASKNSFSTTGVKNYNERVKETEKTLRRVSDLPEKGKLQDWGSLIIGLNQGNELIGKLADSLSFTEEIEQAEADFQRLGLSGEELEKVSEKSFLLNQRFGKDQADIRRAATAMTQTLGGSYSANLDLLEQGLMKGADLNGEMLQSMEEYSGFLRSAGLDGEQAMSFLIEANRKGIFQDKAFDAIKEGSISLREMGKAQQEALSGIGLMPEALKDKTLFESMQLISQSMEGMSQQAQQSVISDIFKGAGEDAVGLFELLRQFRGELSDFENIEPPGSVITEFLGKIKHGISSTIGDISPYIEGVGNLGLAVTGLSQIVKIQSIWTGIATAKQWLLNVAMKANPIGLVITGIAALTTGIVVAYKKVGWFRGAIKGAWEGLKAFGSVITDHILGTFRSLLSGITGIGKAFKQLFSGEFSAAWETGKEAMKDLGSGLVGLSPVGAIISTYQNAGEIGEAIKKGYNNAADNNDAEQEEVVNPKKTPNQPAVMDMATTTGGMVPKIFQNTAPASVADTANTIVTGGKKQTILNVHIDKVLEMGDQIVTEGKEQADDLVDILIESLTRRLSGTFRSATL